MKLEKVEYPKEMIIDKETEGSILDTIISTFGKTLLTLMNILFIENFIRHSCYFKSDKKTYKMSVIIEKIEG